MTTPKLTENRDIAAAKAALEMEIEGLKALQQSLGGDFVSAVELLYGIRGKVIVSGMGKSGHVAKKISATFASTGTPSFFVHPAEASHGDLGMISDVDAVVLLSNSGETAELTDIINYTRRFSIPLIGIVRRAASTLVTAADIALVLPAIPEASPVGAPTTSTTMMMALGDAIAMALLERRGFNMEHFQVFHPGGKLGKRLLTVAELMRTPDALPLVKKDAVMSDVLIEITAKSLGCALVVENGKLVGLITDGDLRRHMGNNLVRQKASEVMTSSPITITPSALASEAVAMMNKRAITSLCVVEESGMLAGLVHIHDLLRAGVV